MSDETRTPSEHTVKSIFVRAHPFALTTSHEERRAEFDRFLAKIKAEALREAAEQIRHKQHPESVRQMLRRRADRIEQEDSNE